MGRSLVFRITAIALLVSFAASAVAAEDANNAKTGTGSAEEAEEEKQTGGNDVPEANADAEQTGEADSAEKDEEKADSAKKEQSRPFNLDASEYIMSLSASDREHLIRDWSRYRYTETKDEMSFIHFEPSVPEPLGTFLIFPEWGGTDKVTGFARMAADEKWDSYIFLPTPDLNSMRPSGNYSEEYLGKSAKAYTDYVRDACAIAEVSGGKVIVAVSGKSSPWLVSMLKTGLLESPAALVLINAWYPEENTAREMAATVAGLDYPVLDLLIEPDSGWLKVSAGARSHEAGKKGNHLFRQAKTSTSEEAERKLRGWLKNISR